MHGKAELERWQFSSWSVPPTNYMTLFKLLGQASPCFSLLLCHWESGLLSPWEHQQTELILQYRTRWRKSQSRPPGTLLQFLLALFTIFCGPTQLSCILVLPALTFDSDLMCHSFDFVLSVNSFLRSHFPYLPCPLPHHLRSCDSVILFLAFIWPQILSICLVCLSWPWTAAWESGVFL